MIMRFDERMALAIAAARTSVKKSTTILSKAEGEPKAEKLVDAQKVIDAMSKEKASLDSLVRESWKAIQDYLAGGSQAYRSRYLPATGHLRLLDPIYNEIARTKQRAIDLCNSPDLAIFRVIQEIVDFTIPIERNLIALKQETDLARNSCP